MLKHTDLVEIKNEMNEELNSDVVHFVLDAEDNIKISWASIGATTSEEAEQFMKDLSKATEMLKNHEKAIKFLNGENI